MGAWSSPSAIPWQRIVGPGIHKVLIPGIFFQCQQLANTSMAVKDPANGLRFRCNCSAKRGMAYIYGQLRSALAEWPTFMVLARSRCGLRLWAIALAGWPSFVGKTLGLMAYIYAEVQVPVLVACPAQRLCVPRRMAHVSGVTALRTRSLAYVSAPRAPLQWYGLRFWRRLFVEARR